MDIINTLVRKHFKTAAIPAFRAGDTVQVHVKIVEGEKSRVQIFEGVVLRKKAGGLNSTFTVRKISNGIGVERTFPYYSPAIDHLEVVARGTSRRSKLYYLRKLEGKAARIDSELQIKKGPNLRRLPKVVWESYGLINVAGVDEAGRGCLAGPVFAAAVILPQNYKLPRLTDSKLLTPDTRTELALRLKAEAVDWAVGVGNVEEIETINILQASLLAMRRAVQNLKHPPELILVDGNQKAGGPWKQETLIKGDLRCLPISAASIIAKTERDHFMVELHKIYPQYGFFDHKGYPTLSHRQAIVDFGPSPVHRRTFAGVREHQLSF